MDAIEQAERAELAKHEEFLRAHIHEYMDAWDAMKLVRKKELWRAEYVSFDAFCRDTLGLSEVEVLKLAPPHCLESM